MKNKINTKKNIIFVLLSEGHLYKFEEGFIYIFDTVWISGKSH